jgi:hypothetical protein
MKKVLAVLVFLLGGGAFLNAMGYEHAECNDQAPYTTIKVFVCCTHPGEWSLMPWRWKAYSLKVDPDAKRFSYGGCTPPTQSSFNCQENTLTVEGESLSRDVAQYTGATPIHCEFKFPPPNK